MAKELITKSEFARRAGITPGMVTKLCKSQLVGAMDGKRIDAAHPAAVAYLEERANEQTEDPLLQDVTEFFNANEKCSITMVQKQFKLSWNRAAMLHAAARYGGVIAPPKKPGIKPAEKPDTTPQPGDKAVYDTDPHFVEPPEELAQFLDMTLRDLVKQFGTGTHFVDWLNAVQKLEAIEEKRIKNAKARGELINRTLVETDVIGTFNAAHLRLLKDGAKTLTAGVVSKNASGMTTNEIENYVSDILGSFIKPVKSKIVRALNNG